MLALLSYNFAIKYMIIKKSKQTLLVPLNIYSSLAIIRFENPDWAMPVIDDEEKAKLISKGIGHPLITKNRVHNYLKEQIH